MYCPNCQMQLEGSSRYCRKCGAQNLITLAEIVANAPMAATPSDLPLPVNEQVIFRLQPSFYSAGLAYLLAATFSLGATILVGYFSGTLKTALILTLAFFIVPIWRHLKRNTTAYTLTNTKIEIEYGLFAKTQRHIPLHNIQDVTVRASLRKRLLSIGDVIIDSASVAGKIQMLNVQQPRQHADLILAQLPRRP